MHFQNTDTPQNWFVSSIVFWWHSMIAKSLVLATRIKDYFIDIKRLISNFLCLFLLEELVIYFCQCAFCFVLLVSHKLTQFLLYLFSLLFANTRSSSWQETSSKKHLDPYKDVLELIIGSESYLYGCSIQRGYSFIFTELYLVFNLLCCILVLTTENSQSDYTCPCQLLIMRPRENSS